MSKDYIDWKNERRPVRDAVVGGITGSVFGAPAGIAASYFLRNKPKTKRYIVPTVMFPSTFVGAYSGYGGSPRAAHPIKCLTDRNYDKRMLSGISEYHKRNNNRIR